MSRDPRERFDATADDYVRHRPGYPDALVDWVLPRALLSAGATIADLGCGTGIATRLFAARGYEVVGVDPSEGMLSHARAQMHTGEGRVRYLRGEAAATGLPAASIDLAISGQAFHWFERDATFWELARILKPGAPCAAFWNRRAETPLLLEYEAALRRFVAGYDERPHSDPTLAAIRRRPDARGVEEAEFANVQRLDLAGLIGRAHSSSYVAHEVREREALDRALAEIFSRYERAGYIEFVYRTVVILWRLGP